MRFFKCSYTLNFLVYVCASASVSFNSGLKLHVGVTCFSGGRVYGRFPDFCRRVDQALAFPLSYFRHSSLRTIAFHWTTVNSIPFGPALCFRFIEMSVI